MRLPARRIVVSGAVIALLCVALGRKFAPRAVTLPSALVLLDRPSHSRAHSHLRIDPVTGRVSVLAEDGSAFHGELLTNEAGRFRRDGSPTPPENNHQVYSRGTAAVFKGIPYTDSLAGINENRYLASRFALAKPRRYAGL